MTTRTDRRARQGATPGGGIGSEFLGGFLRQMEVAHSGSNRDNGAFSRAKRPGGEEGYTKDWRDEPTKGTALLVADVL